MAGVNLTFACTCGTVQGALHDITPPCGQQLQCHCDDCRRAVIWLGQADPGSDGVAYYQTTPNRVSLDSGQTSLRAFTWKNRRLVRWYASCCNAPLFNTMNSPKWAFASIVVDRLTDPTPLGPVRCHTYIAKPGGKRGNIKFAGFLWNFAKRTTAARLNGTWRDTPFFDATGTPIAPLRQLAETDRATAPL